MSRECCGPEEQVVPEPDDACCGPSQRVGHDIERPPWWRDRVLALPVAAGLLWVTGLMLDWTGLELAALTAFALSLVAGAPLEQDLRAEIDLMRSELDLVKRELRRVAARQDQARQDQAQPDQ